MFFLKKPPRNRLSAQDAVARSAEGDVVVLDVREHAEVSGSGKAEGAVHVPLMRLRDVADPRHPDYNDALKQDGTIAIYCASGGRSASAEMLLRQLGYQDVHNIGGLGHWMRAGGRIEPA